MPRSWSKPLVFASPRAPRPSYSELDAASLVARLKAADARAAAELWDRYAARIRGLLRRALAPSSDIDDVQQEVFIQIFQSIHRLRDDEALSAFVLSIATNVVRSELRRRHRRRGREVNGEGAAREGFISQAPEARQALQRLQEILKALSPDLRLAFILRYVEQLELSEVAEAMSWSLATTKRRLKRARSVIFAQARRDPLLERFLGDGGDR